MKTKTVLFLLPVIICCLAGCAEPDTVEEPVTEPEEIPDDRALPWWEVPDDKLPEYIYPEENENRKVTTFKDMTIEEIQEMMQGRWEVVRYCNDWGCYNSVGTYHEFAGTDTIRRINTITPDSNTVLFMPIHSWEKKKYGILINLKITSVRSENSGVYFLHYIINDTLYCSGSSIFTPDWWMKKTD
jgi:uncharacterized protein YerC